MPPPHDPQPLPSLVDLQRARESTRDADVERWLRAYVGGFEAGFKGTGRNCPVEVRRELIAQGAVAFAAGLLREATAASGGGARAHSDGVVAVAWEVLHHAMARGDHADPAESETAERVLDTPGKPSLIQLVVAEAKRAPWRRDGETLRVAFLVLSTAPSLEKFVPRVVAAQGLRVCAEIVARKDALLSHKSPFYKENFDRAMRTLQNAALFPIARRALLAVNALELAAGLQDVTVPRDAELTTAIRLSAASLVIRLAGRDEVGVGADVIDHFQGLIDDQRALLEKVVALEPHMSVFGRRFDPAEIVEDIAILATADRNKRKLATVVPALAQALAQRGGSNLRLVRLCVEALAQLSFEPACEPKLQASAPVFVPALKFFVLDKDTSVVGAELRITALSLVEQFGAFATQSSAAVGVVEVAEEEAERAVLQRVGDAVAGGKGAVTRGTPAAAAPSRRRGSNSGGGGGAGVGSSFRVARFFAAPGSAASAESRSAAPTPAPAPAPPPPAAAPLPPSFASASASASPSPSASRPPPRPVTTLAFEVVAGDVLSASPENDDDDEENAAADDAAPVAPNPASPIATPAPARAPAPSSTTRKPTHLMISYCQRASRNHVADLVRRFDLLEMPVWVDYRDMGGNVDDSMAIAVEGAAVVLVFVSRAYKESVACRRELKYASKLERPVIFLVSEMEFINDAKEGGGGWLALLMEDALWIDVSSAQARDANFDSLVKRVREKGVGSLSGSSKPTSKEVTAQVEKQHSTVAVAVAGDAPPAWVADLVLALRSVQSDLADVKRDLASVKSAVASFRASQHPGPDASS